MTKAQAALIAASNFKENDMDDDIDTVFNVANKYLKWLDNKISPVSPQDKQEAIP